MKDIIVTDHAPKPIGPYSQAVRANGFLFAAQIALDPNTNTLLEGDVAQQTERVLENLKVILTQTDSLSRCEDHGVPERHERFCGNERSIRGIFPRSRPGVFDRAGRRSTEGCTGRN
jgi:endoribonuclease L-PSP